MENDEHFAMMIPYFMMMNMMIPYFMMMNMMIPYFNDKYVSIYRSIINN